MACAVCVCAAAIAQEKAAGKRPKRPEPAKAAAPLTLDERPAIEQEWGYRPADGSVSATNPPSFSWRPQKDIVAWELECGRNGDFQTPEYRVTGVTFNVHCPPKTLAPGTYSWRYCGVDRRGKRTNWSQVRSFTIPAGAVAMPMPPRADLLARIPKSHPRLFIRPEDLARLREAAKGRLGGQFHRLVADCDRLLASPPPTAEPAKYPAGLPRGGEAWRKIWWGNRMYTMRALDGAATLAFTRLLGGKDEYGQLAKRILLDCARWDPQGATGYRYNDEAGMPYNSRFARTYTFVYDLLSEKERAECRRVMKIRGDEMYKHLCPRHLWQPYASHSNRAWHFLGEVGVAFLGEIEGADDWVWFAMNVFYNTYPVWSDDDGGWHEGPSYWSSYINRFTWWADIMRSEMGINAFQKPYFSKAGDLPLYLMPPGKVGGGFGDGASRMKATAVVPLMTELAAQAGNGHWQWYVEQMGGPRESPGYVGFVRGMLPKVQPTLPDKLPASRLFRGTGLAVLNTTLQRADQDVQVVFKSSPMGTQSHGNESHNSFVLWAYGQQLLLRTGHYYSYGDPHHRGWVWSTRSLNNITVDGHDQAPVRSAETKGKIVDFQTTPSMDAVVGEAGDAYRVIEPGGKRRPLLDRYTRTILFVKPELVIVYDRLAARDPSVIQYWLHAANQFKADDQRKVEVRAGDVACDIDFLAPEGLKFSQTNQYDPNPEPQITAREWHLTAATPGKLKTVEFVTLYRPHRSAQTAPQQAELKRVAGGYVLDARLSDGRVLALLPTDDSVSLAAGDLKTQGKVLIQRYRADGSVAGTLRVGQTDACDCDPPAQTPAPRNKEKRIVLFGGVKTHGPGAHEHPKDAKLWKDWLDRTPGLPPLKTQLYLDTWPEDPSELDQADTIVVFWEGWERHLLNSRQPERAKKLDQLMRRGVGFVCFHAATAVDNDVESLFLDWVGGNKKRDYSLHPMARNVKLALATPEHPVCRGVRPMEFPEEEFYCKIMFRPNDRRITPILTTMLPPDKPEKQIVAWCCERADGGRAFACTGPHYHANYQQPDMRKLVLNAILWTAKIEPPRVESRGSASPTSVAGPSQP